jgi:hypothetical protein
MASHRIVARSSPHTSLTAPLPPAPAYPQIPPASGGSPETPSPPCVPPAHFQQPPRPDESAERGDEGPHLGEGDGAVDHGPAVGFRTGGGSVGVSLEVSEGRQKAGRSFFYVVVIVLKRRYLWLQARLLSPPPTLPKKERL